MLALTRAPEAAGFQPANAARSFESNVLYDTPDRTMRARTEILRIRSYAGRWTLTHKRLPDAGPGEDRHKHRIETETEVADGNALAEVFLSLGLVAAFRYEKWRTEWRMAKAIAWWTKRRSATLPSSKARPSGSIGPPRAWALSPAEYITLSYGRLFDQWREQHRSDAKDLTFAAVADAS